MPIPHGYAHRRQLPGAEVLPREEWRLNDYQAILAQADAALARRREAYPALVERAAMTAEDAAADIAAWLALAAEWRWICTGRGALPASWTLFDRIDAVDRAIDRARMALSRAPRSADLQEQLDLYLAMRWHLSRLRFGDPAIHFTASVTHALRARLATCPTCERRREDPVTRACTRNDCGLPDRTPELTATGKEAA